MRLLSAAIVLSLVAATASAQTPLRTFSPATAALHKVVLKAPPHVGPAPRVYTVQQRALAVRKLLNLTTVPTLSQTITLTPSVPIIAGTAELDYNNASVWSGNFDNLVPAGGEAELHNTQAGYVRIKFNVHSGQRYVFDCRADPSPTPITYNVYLYASEQDGTVSIGPDGHFIFVTYKAPSDEIPIVLLSQAGQSPATWVFYGCDISPF